MKRKKRSEQTNHYEDQLDAGSVHWLQLGGYNKSLWYPPRAAFNPTTWMRTREAKDGDGGMGEKWCEYKINWE